ncbi:uncharacterized protein LOC123408244 [Hordeum vulgare subsp. vulgare]|uniref:uncharacterized protein LOC123408244 n=1 Tax=Hordeum vulgare subsp. vulgare TaxID=112509 RepID=UPI001D1A54C2|nr:uncharacterized protein LOC123408244 [Hordeum vulgare subsp. vulgare]
MEKLQKVNKNQDAKIMELEEKMRRMERRPYQEISDPMATIGIEPSVNGHNSNRKRVLAPPVDGPQLVKKPSNLHNKPSMSNDSDLQVSNKNSVSDKNKETMVHNGGSARQLEKCFAGHKNVVRNQEAFDHSYTAQQGETNSAAHKVCFCYHTQYVQNILLHCLCIYWLSCYQNVVQNK